MKYISDLEEESIRLYEIHATLEEITADGHISTDEVQTLLALTPVLRNSASRIDRIAVNQQEAARLMFHGLRYSEERQQHGKGKPQTGGAARGGGRNEAA